MKKIIFILLAVTFASSLCFAQQASAPAMTKSAPKPVEVKKFSGKVDSVSIGDAAKGIKPGIVVVNEKAQKLSFVLKTGTTITANDGKALKLSDLKKDTKVAVEYTIGRTGIHKAQSIKVVE